VQRADDAEETVRKRLRVYHLQTAPVIHFYEELGVVMKVDGTGSIDVVNREIKMLLHDTTA
jgi:adenylate kinase